MIFCRNQPLNRQLTDLGARFRGALSKRALSTDAAHAPVRAFVTTLTLLRQEVGLSEECRPHCIGSML